MRKVVIPILLLLIVFSSISTGASPIRTEVPIYVPANLPVTGTVCLPSYMAVGLRAKLYVDDEFVDEGRSDEVGCYRITIKPLPPGKHELYSKIYKGETLVAEISIEVIAIEGMVEVKPKSITIKRGETGKVTLFLENRSPINMSHVGLQIDSPFPVFGEHMTRVRNFVIRGSLGNLLMNETKEIRLELAIPSEFKPGTYQLKLNMTYEVGGAIYSAPLSVSVIISSEKVPVTEAQGITPAPSHTSSEISTTEFPTWMFLIIAFLGIIAVSSVLWLTSRPDRIDGQGI